MQAPQSNIASERPGSASPLTAPIHAARKYLERQRVGYQADDKAGQVSEVAAAAFGDLGDLDDLGAGGGTGNSAARFEPNPFGALELTGFRDEDESFERATDQGLVNRGVQASHVRDRDIRGLDVPGCGETGTLLSPDAGAVRAAIFRLARESKWTQRIAAEGFGPDREAKYQISSSSLFGDDGPVWNLLDEAVASAAQTAVPEIASEQAASAQAANAQADNQGGAKDFEEVALRVWGESPEASSAEAYGPSGTKTVPVDPEASSSFFYSSHPVEENAMASVLATPVARFDGTAGSSASSSSPSPSSASSSSSAPAGETRLADGPALAHDAGNLLSAMGLYSELLSLSGVLQASHRHYADDLKLLVGRGHVLIERLLGVSCGPAADGSTPSYEKLEPGSLRTATSNFAATSYVAPPSATSLGRDLAKILSASVAELRPVARPGIRLRAGADSPSTRVNQPQSQQTNLRQANLRHLKEPQKQSSIVDLLTQWSSLLSTIAHGAVTFEFGPWADLPIAVPSESIERIVVNLVRNATEAIRSGGAIRIGVGAFTSDGRAIPAGDSSSDWAGDSVVDSAGNSAGRRMVLRVDDSGCGMSEEQMRRVLAGAAPLHEAVFRSPGYGSWAGVDLATSGRGDVAAGAGPEDAGRRGLGLQIVRELVAASHGAIFIQSRPGKGTRIEIQWPVSEVVHVATKTGMVSRSALERDLSGPWQSAAPPAIRRTGLHLADLAAPVEPENDLRVNGRDGQERGAIAC